MAILSFSGDIELFIGDFYPTQSQNGIQVSKLEKFQIFDEKQDVLLSRNIKTAMPNPTYVEIEGAFANYEPANLSDSSLAFDWDADPAMMPELSAGIVINSHFIAFAVKGRQTKTAEIIFDGPIVGLIDTRDSNETNDLFSFTEYVNPNAQTLEGLRWRTNYLGVPFLEARDYVKITGENDNILQIRWTSNGYEGLRVLTLPSGDIPQNPDPTPEPETGGQTLIGTSGADKLIGTRGNDILNGKAGPDNLSGLGGEDTFVFQFGESPATKAGADTIQDFVMGLDKIDLLTQGGQALSPPVNFTRAADAKVWHVATIVNSVFEDANGALAGNQPLGVNSAALIKGLGNSSYLIINDGVAGLQAQNDILVRLNNLSGAWPDFGAIAVDQFFV